ncbi:MAG: DNA-binding protein [Candidatus Omnitrophota bacterium]
MPGFEINSFDCQNLNNKIKSLLFTLSLVFMFFNLNINSALSQAVSGTDLINNATTYDGLEITYKGEVIGELMRRQEHSWANIYDGNVSIGVWLDNRMAQEVNFTGSYKFQGDTVEVSGIFHRTCSEHGGDLDIHAQKLRITSRGYPHRERLDLDKKRWVLILGAITLILWILTLLKHR